MSLKPNTFSEFIVADEEELASPSYNNAASPPPSPVTGSYTTNNPTISSANDFFKPGSWAPKVDLSSAFNPFMTQLSGAINENNQVRERQYTGGDTLDEPVWVTLKRDLAQIGKRLVIVLWPLRLKKLARLQQGRLIDFAASNGISIPQSIISSRRISVDENTRDDEGNGGGDFNTAMMENNLTWDLWGPLLFSLTYSVTLGLTAAGGNLANSVFSGSFAFTWLLYLAIGLNIQLLGGSVSFLSAISALGYSMFPIVIGGLICALVVHWWVLRLPLMIIMTIWSVYVSALSLECSGVLPGRVVLAIYPVCLLYTLMSWLVVIT